MTKKLVANFFACLFLCSCSSMGDFFKSLSTADTDIQTVLQDARTPATRVPLYTYKADLQLTVDGATFDGIGVTAARNQGIQIGILSQIDLDRVEAETCARLDVCEAGKPCPAAFAMDSGWFGSSGKHLVYGYAPSAVEVKGNCPIYFRVYSKKDLAAWGFLALRPPDETLQGHFTCNGVGWLFDGHSVCQTKAGLIQRLQFQTPVDDYDVDKECGLTQVDKQTFELRPALALCTGKFLSQGKWHGLDLFGYDTVLVGN